MARGKPGQRAVAVGDRVPGVLPALVLEPGLLVAALVGDVAVALEVGVLVDPAAAPRGPRTRARGRARCRRSTARTRRAGRRTAASRRRCRSTASAVAPRTRSSRRSASRAGSGPGPRRGSRRCGCPAGAPSSRRVVAASSGVNGSACRLVKMLSRPNIVMNHGSPAAGRLWRPARERREPQRGQIDEAAAVGRLQRLPVALEPRGLVEPARRGSSPCSADGAAPAGQRPARCPRLAARAAR